MIIIIRSAPSLGLDWEGPSCSTLSVDSEREMRREAKKNKKNIAGHRYTDECMELSHTVCSPELQK